MCNIYNTAEAQCVIKTLDYKPQEKKHSRKKQVAVRFFLLHKLLCLYPQFHDYYLTIQMIFRNKCGDTTSYMEQSIVLF